MDPEAEVLLRMAAYAALEEIVARGADLGRYVYLGGDEPLSLHDAVWAYHTAVNAAERVKR